MIITQKNGISLNIDECDLHHLKYLWSFTGSGYLRRNFNLPDGKQKSIILHRVIMNAKDTELVDHIDMDKTNVCRSNLRICTKSQNGMNRNRTKTKTSSKYKGVGIDNRRNGFRAYIGLKGTCKSLGQFKTEEDAAIAYNKAAIIYHGEFARLNKIP